MSRYTAVLDACVLVPIALADTLLRVAERGMFRPLWSSRILLEAQTAIEEIHPGIDVGKRFASMREAFGDAMVTGQNYGRVRAMMNEHGEWVDDVPPGFPVEVLGLDASVGGDGIVADKSIKTVKQLKGQKIAVSEGSTRATYGESSRLGVTRTLLSIRTMPKSASHKLSECADIRTPCALASLSSSAATSAAPCGRLRGDLAKSFCNK